MTQSPWKFVQTFPVPDVGLDMLRAAGSVVQVFDPQPGEVEANMAGTHVIVAGTEPITESTFEVSPDLEIIGRFGAGVDSVDVEAATRRGIAVLNTPGMNSQTVAEHTFALLLGITHHVAQADASTRTDAFKLRTVLVGMELEGKTLGIVGLGDIGSRVARIGHFGFGMKLLIHTANPRPQRLADLGIEARYVDLNELMSASDVVTLHTALTPETTGMISRERLELMKPGAYLINTARGTLIDEEALADLLAANRIRGAGLDVFVVEPPSLDNPLFQLPNVVLTPHMSSNSDDAFARMGILLCESILERLQGGRPWNCVNPEVYG